MGKLYASISLHVAKARALAAREFKEMGVYVYAYKRCCVQGLDKMFLFEKGKHARNLQIASTDRKEPSLNQQTSALPGIESASG